MINPMPVLINNPARLLTTSGLDLPTETFAENYAPPVPEVFVRSVLPVQHLTADGRLETVYPLKVFSYGTREIEERGDVIGKAYPQTPEKKESRLEKISGAFAHFASTTLDAIRTKSIWIRNTLATIPSETVKQPTYPVRLSWRLWKGFWKESADFFSGHRLIGRTLPLLVIGSSFVRGCADYSTLEIDRYAHMIDTPADTSDEVKKQSLDWRKSLSLIRQYPNDAELVKRLIDGMLSEVKTPEGALYLALVLQETFLLSPTLDVDTKAGYQEWTRSAFEAATKIEFGLTVTALHHKGVLDSFDSDGDGITDTQPTDEQKKVIKSFLKDLEEEKTALIVLNKEHTDWVEEQLTRRMRFDDPENPGIVVLENPEASQIQSTIEALHSREKRLNRLPTDWETVRYKLALDATGQYQSAVDQSFVLMSNDFSQHNRAYWGEWFSSTTDMDSGLLGVGSSLAGLFYFLPAHSLAGFIFTPMVYGAAGASISAPAQAHDAYLERHLMLLVLPEMVAKGE